MYTKGDFAAAAFEEIGLANYIFDIAPEELQSVLRKLDAMMATWNGQGIRIGYAASSDPGKVSKDTPSGVSDEANEAVSLNLAVRIAPGYGKILSKATSGAAKMAYDQLMSKVLSNPPEMQMPGMMPRGAGNKWSSYAFVRPPTDALTTGPDAELTFD
jgi:P22 tail accessory factor